MATEKKQSFFGGAAVLAAGVVIVKIIGALFKIPLANILSETGNADFNNAYNIYAVLLTISTAGLPVALSKMISEAKTLGRERQARRVLKVSFAAFLTLGVLSFVIMWFGNEKCAALLNNPNAAYGIKALAPGVVCVGCLAAFRGFAQGSFRMTPTAVSQIIEAVSKLMSGRDVAIAALLGAEEFGFGTGPLVAMGCVMMRVCNLDTCPMGICTQNPELRKRFKGKPEYIMNFMRFMAEDLREYMAKLGVRTVDELVGRTDLLKVKAAPAGSRAGEMDLTALLQNPLVENSNVHFNAKDVYNFQLEKTPDMRILMKKFKKSFDSAEPKPSTVTLDVGNTDRAFGTIIGSEITARFGNTLPDDTFHVVCHGYGGQSFGAFIPKGLTLELVGDANDYIGKGLSGGKLVVYPPKDAAFDRSENIVIGNVALYGATGGTAFINGVAGERFCVRNSGATAVVEGVGDHGCEYMTGGTVVVLGKTGKNFAAGMSGGIAYVLDEDWDFYQRVNKDMVSLEPVEHKYDVSLLKDLIREHVELTGSPRGREILDNFGEYLPKFKKVLPHDYDKMLRLIAQMEEKGEDSEQAQIEAFYAMKSAK